MTETLLVFGAAGQLAQELMKQAASKNILVTGLTRAEVDIADAAAVTAAVTRIKPDVIINAAAYTKVDKAESEIPAATLANETGPRILAQICRASNLPLVHISTDYVFDGTKNAPYVEEDPVAPLSVYGRTKEAGERAIREELTEHIILRTNWVYGVYGANFLKTILRLAGDRDELKIVADQWGNPTATADIASAIFAVTDKVRAGGALPWGTYHFSGTGDTSWHGFATAIVAAQASITGRLPTVTPITTAEYPTAACRPTNSRLDSGRFFATFGLAAQPWQLRTAEVVRKLLDRAAT